MTDRELSVISAQSTWQGFRQMLPIAGFVMIFGAAFGLAALQQGLDIATILWMSALVFAGASQFATLEFWGAEVPVFTLILTVFAINARHLLMGATLYPWLQHVPPRRRYGVMMVASDANWAMAMQAFGRAQPGFGVLFGGGLALWLAWIAGTWLGVEVGDLISDGRRWGLDMVMGCFLLALVAGGKRSPRTILIWIVSAAASLAAYEYLPENTHVVIGAIAGGVIGMVWLEKTS
jgi:predicted branched-subunit amino acid permease